MMLVLTLNLRPTDLDSTWLSISWEDLLFTMINTWMSSFSWSPNYRAKSKVCAVMQMELQHLR